MNYDQTYINARSIGEAKQAVLYLKSGGYHKQAMVLSLISNYILNGQGARLVNVLAKCREKLTINAVKLSNDLERKVKNARKD